MIFLELRELEKFDCFFDIEMVVGFFPFHFREGFRVREIQVSRGC